MANFPRPPHPYESRTLPMHSTYPGPGGAYEPFLETQSLHPATGIPSGMRTYPFPVPQNTYTGSQPMLPSPGQTVPQPAGQTCLQKTSSPASSLSLTGLQNLVESLQISIAYGEEEQAVQLATLLSKYKTRIKMLLDKEETEISDFKLRVYVEYKQTSAGCIVLRVSPQNTIGDLKRKMLFDYKLPTKLQRWIVGKRLPADSETLESLGITASTADTMAVFLYMMSAKFAGIDRQQVERELRESSGMPDLQDPDIEGYEVVPPVNQPVESAAIPVSTQRNQRPASVSGPPGVAEPVDVTARAAPLRRSTGQIHEMFPAVPEELKEPLRWDCPACTFQNYPTWPGCEQCNTERPPDFKIPDDYVYTQREMERINQEAISETQFQEVTEQEMMMRERRQAEEEASRRPMVSAMICPAHLSHIRMLNDRLAMRVEQSDESSDENI